MFLQDFSMEAAVELSRNAQKWQYWHLRLTYGDSKKQIRLAVGIEPRTPAVAVQHSPYQRKPSVEGQFK